MEDTHSGWFALAFALALSCVAFLLIYPPLFEEYSSGYRAGYTEHNVTKYKTAVCTYKTFMPFEETVIDNSERSYAIGYADGYEQYKREENIKVLKSNE